MVDVVRFLREMEEKMDLCETALKASRRVRFWQALSTTATLVLVGEEEPRTPEEREWQRFFSAKASEAMDDIPSLTVPQPQPGQEDQRKNPKPQPLQ